jgi:hypothetical protein
VARPLIHWYRSPLNRKLRRFGEYFIDEAGQIIGWVQRTQFPGYAAGSAYSNTFGPNAPPSYPTPALTDDQDATVQAR